MPLDFVDAPFIKFTLAVNSLFDKLLTKGNKV